MWFKFPFPLHFLSGQSANKDEKVQSPEGERRWKWLAEYELYSQPKNTGQLILTAVGDSQTQTVKRASFYMAMKIIRQVTGTWGDRKSALRTWDMTPSHLSLSISSTITQ